jgi:uncharacterized protein
VTPVRIVAVDAVRGMAVMGILLMNIVAFGLPVSAYADPTIAGGATGDNWWAWALSYIVADGKFRALFTMLFGASTILIAERALAAGRSAGRVHYARMFWLFVIGMIHAYLIWYGDILVLYAVCGALIFVVWRWPPRLLATIGALVLVAQLGAGLATYRAVTALRAQATAPLASPDVIADWADLQIQFEPAPDKLDSEVAAYRGGYRENLGQRVRTALFFQTQIELLSIPETLALMAIGMALFRWGFFSGAWPIRYYALIATWGYGLTIIPEILLLRWLTDDAFSGVTAVATDAIHLSLLRPFVALAHASVIIMLVKSGVVPRLARRIADVGQMAISNYVATSIVCTTIFYGFGFGWFGHLVRWQLYPVVAVVWVLMLLWSKPWLDRFRYGPLEWLWRSLARWQLQPMQR